MKFYYYLILILFPTISFSEKIKIRILSHLKITEFILSCEKGNLKIIGDKSDTLTLNAGNSLTILKTNDSIELKSNEKSFGKFVWVRFYNQTQENLLSIKSINPDRKKRFYEDHLIVAIDKTNSCLRLINLLEMDKYIGGVVEAESGKRSHPEFYKTQAILARTYALSIIGRHIAEGHDLCDQVHCQAFYGRTKEPDIINGVISTREYVVVDREYNLINAVFHSNSGGQTANVEDVWGNPNSYLKSVRDSFSINMPNYQWTRKMSVEDWLEYLKIKHKVPFEDSSSRLSALNFNQPKRKSHLEINGRKIPLKIIRTDLNLKSTFFDLKTENDTMTFMGRGYGHGIGMCQEGAMKMAKLGYSYEQVIKFYYRDVTLINRQQLAFFREH